MTAEPTPIERARTGRRDGADPTPIDRDYTEPPNSVQSEEAVIGSILKNPSAIAHVAADLRPSDFYSPKCQRIYAAMLALFERSRPIDYHTTGDELNRQGTYEAAGGLLYLSQISLATPSAAYIQDYAKAVRRTKHCRDIAEAGQTIAELAYADTLEEDELARRAQATVASASARSMAKRLIMPDELSTRYLDRMEAINETGSMGISTGLLELDSVTLGLSPGQLILLCARPTMGKSELAGQIAVDVARGHAPSGGRCPPGKGWVLVVSMEMFEEELTERYASMLSGVDKSRLLTGHMNDLELQRLNESLSILHDSRLAVVVEPGITSSDVRAMALQLEAAHGKIDLIVVDYVQLLTDKKAQQSTRSDDLGWAAQQLKKLAVDLGCTVLAPAQLSPEVDKRVSDRRPLLSDIRDSGELAQACDIMLAMYREDYYDANSSHKGVAEITTRKHRRYGRIRGATAKLFYAQTRYVDLARMP